MLKRNCPICFNQINYKSKDAITIATKRNSICRSCSTKKQYVTNPNKNKGKTNGRYGKSLLEICINKYGSEAALLKYKSWSEQLGAHGFKSGELNPSFGNQPPLNSGKSYKGWYKNLFFRSVLELLFIFDYENKYKTLPLSADKPEFRVKYKFQLKNRTYIPDFFCPIENIIFELKCSQFINEPINIAKALEANNMFFNKYTYKVLTELDIKNFPGFDSFIPKLKLLNDNKTIKLTDKSIIKLNNRLKI